MAFFVLDNDSNVSNNEKRMYEVFRLGFFMNSAMFVISSIMFYCLIDPFIVLWIGNTYLLDKWAVLIIVLSFFVMGVQLTVEQFKSACGLYWQDRFRVLLEGILNIIVSIFLVQKIGISGVFLGAFISNMATTFWIEPFIVFKNVFKKPVIHYFLNYSLFAVVGLCIGFIVSFAADKIFLNYDILSFLLRFLFVGGLSTVLFVLTFFWKQEFKESKAFIVKIVLSKFKKGEV